MLLCTAFFVIQIDLTVFHSEYHQSTRAGSTDFTLVHPAAEAAADFQSLFFGNPELLRERGEYRLRAHISLSEQLKYCSEPANEEYEKLAVFVPAGYFNATENSDGTYTCELKSDATVGSYTAATAPIVMPINTPGYSSQKALSDYTDVSDYTNQGFSV